MTGKPPLIRVLLVEDDRDDMSLIIEMMERGRGNYHVETADNVDDAHEILGSTAIDVCLVDYLLGDSTGLDFVESSREQGHTCNFVLITGVGSPDIDDRAEALGVVQYLSKDEITVDSIDRALRYGRPRLDSSQQFIPKRKGTLALQIALARDAGIQEAAEASGVSVRTAQRRMRQPGFMEEVARLRTELADRMLDIAAREALYESESG